MAITKVSSGLISADASSIDLNIDAGTLYLDVSENRVGIGTTSPSNALDINGSQVLLANGALKFADAGNSHIGMIKNSGSSGTGQLEFYTGSAPTERMRIDSSGKVGIGTSSPTEKLTVNGALAVTGALADDRTSTGTMDYISGYTRFVAYGASGETGSFTFNTAAGGSSSTQKVVIDGSGNVGIAAIPSGEASAAHVVRLGDQVCIAEYDDGSNPEQFNLFHNSDSSETYIETGTASVIQQRAGDIIFKNAASGSAGAAISFAERMRIDSSGNLLVGTTDVDLGYTDGDSGVALKPAGLIQAARDSAYSILYLNKLNNDGPLIDFHKDGSTVGSIEIVAGLYTAYNTENNTGYLSSNSTTQYAWDPSRIYPTSDNAKDLGLLSHRFDDIFATNGTIQTSDRNEKQDIAELSDAETRVAVAAKGLLRKFRWIDSVEEKGDEARTHFGIIAQDLQDAFTAEGLDAGDYAMFISSTWTDDDGVEQTRLGVRYSELLAFIIAAI